MSFGSFLAQRSTSDQKVGYLSRGRAGDLAADFIGRDVPAHAPERVSGC